MRCIDLVARQKIINLSFLQTEVCMALTYLQVNLKTAHNRLEEIDPNYVSELDLRELEEKIARVNELLLEMITAQEDALC